MPALLLLRYDLILIVFTILVSEFLCGVTAGIAHHKVGNIKITKLSSDTKIIAWLLFFGIIGMIMASILILKIPSTYIKWYIGIKVTLLGILTFFTIKKKFKFSWVKMAIASAVAAFNKGISGGGSGPLMIFGQVISGVKAKHSVGISCLVKGILCLIGIIMYVLLSKFTLGIFLSLAVVVGAISAVFFAVRLTKKLSEKSLKTSVAVVMTFLGIVSIMRLL